MKKSVLGLIIILIILFSIILIILFSPTACETEYRLCYDGVERWKIQSKDGIFPWNDRFEIQGFCGEKDTIYYYDEQEALKELKLLRDFKKSQKEIDNRKWRCK